MQYHNKSYLLNIPSWDWRRGDDAVCVAELKLGILAQNCLSPGFSTLLANLFSMRTYKKDPSGQTPAWLNQYMQGAGIEMYTETMSSAFVGMPFPAAAELCFVRLNLLLIAVQMTKKGHGEAAASARIAINPKVTEPHALSACVYLKLHYKRPKLPFLVFQFTGHSLECYFGGILCYQNLNLDWKKERPTGSRYMKATHKLVRLIALMSTFSIQKGVTCAWSSESVVGRKISSGRGARIYCAVCPTLFFGDAEELLRLSQLSELSMHDI
ncbi:unnamed protein product [Protopolystoma xenopodis]|uniref:Calcium-activated potassium channel BK alpha subunit domain-containing protein n=1 Tax=Protopolystoma xenopodis TaxID=117903 RepID=A0A3S5B2L1_9PLAT|nr:unnamed protein product [Protopolystoma xenopodis]